MKKFIVFLCFCVVVAGAMAGPTWTDVTIVNSDFEVFSGSGATVNFTGWMQQNIELGGRADGVGNNYAVFDNGGGNTTGNIRQLVTVEQETNGLKLDFKFKGNFGVPPAGEEYNSIFKAMVHADADGAGGIWDMYHVMWSTDVTTGWMDVTTYWYTNNPIDPAGLLDPNARIKFEWTKDPRLFSSGIDDIRLQATTVPVPEPATMCLLSLGGLFLRRRKR